MKQNSITNQKPALLINNKKARRDFVVVIQIFRVDRRSFMKQGGDAIFPHFA
jgi:hypothetical protein